jgi:tetratricopeptide (TPR) repeat protein
MPRSTIVLCGFLLVISIAAGESLAQDVTAGNRSVAAGRDIVNSQIIIGIPPEQLAGIIEASRKDLKDLTEHQKHEIETLKENLGVNEHALRAFFTILGEREVPSEKLATKLLEIAGNYKDLLVEAAPGPNDGPEIAKIKAAAKEALTAGQLNRADELLERIQELQDAAVLSIELEGAGTSAQRGQLAMAQLRYRDAARQFADAAQRVPEARADIRLSYLDQEADALYRQGDERGENESLISAIRRYQNILTIRPRERVPLDWAATQNNLGDALERLGERETGTARLEEAVVAYRAGLEAVAAYYAALEEDVRYRASWINWAMTQMNLGAALQALGSREGGTARLEEAVAAYRAALEEYTRDRAPLQWAMAQTNLGNVLQTLWEREGKTARLDEAVVAYRAALEECPRARVPLQWAMTQNNLGKALWALGARESGAGRLEEAVAAYRAALGEYTRDRAPLQWAMTQNNLGIALKTLGERESGTARLEDAVAAYRAALDEYIPDRVPLQWAQTKMNLGNALATLGARASGTARQEEAVAAYSEALEQDPLPIDRANIQFNMGLALVALGRRAEALSYFRRAEAVFRAAGMAEPAERGHNLIIWLRRKIDTDSPSTAAPPNPDPNH